MSDTSVIFQILKVKIKSTFGSFITGSLITTSLKTSTEMVT